MFSMSPVFGPGSDCITSTAVINVFFTAILANVHSFLVVISNHAADDIYRFEEPGKSRGEFHLRKV
jgi:hypothetical protein